MKRSFILSTLLGNDENYCPALKKFEKVITYLQKIGKKQVEQNQIMIVQCIHDTFDFWILRFFILACNESTISSNISITLLVEFPWHLLSESLVFLDSLVLA